MSGGFAQIDWDGLSWARRRFASEPGRAEACRRCCSAGDLIYVVSRRPRRRRSSRRCPTAQSALVALDPKDGAVVALVGGFDYFANKCNRVTQARRQPGSGFKPFLYSVRARARLHARERHHGCADRADGDGGIEQTWRPENDGGDFSGPTRLREALVHSRNLVSIRLLRARRHRRRDRLRHRASASTRATMPNEPDARARHAAGDAAASGHRLRRLRQRRLQGEPYFIDRIENAAGVDRVARRAQGSLRWL